MTDELKPCPFCGGEAETCSYYFEEKNMTLWQVRCKERPYDVEHPCYTADSFISFATEAEAIEAWNTRAERTCRILQAYGDESAELDYLMDEIAGTPEDTVACICQSCDHEFRYDRRLRPKFCPNCGAKVVM